MKRSFIRLTWSYGAGVLVGFGFGLLVANWLSWGWHPIILVLSLTMMAIGSYTELYLQNKRIEKEEGSIVAEREDW
jgi:hypothetical protein